MVKEPAKIDAIDEKSCTVRAGAGVGLAELREKLAAQGYVLCPQGSGTVGEWAASGAPGVRERVAILECTLPGGKTFVSPDSPRSAAGPDFKQLVIGAGGSLGEITAVKLRIRRAPEHRAVVAVDFPDWPRGCEALREIAQRGLAPDVCLLDEALTAKDKRGARGVLAVFACEGMKKLAEFDARKISTICGEQYGRILQESASVPPTPESAARIKVTWTELPSARKKLRELNEGAATYLCEAAITGATLCLIAGNAAERNSLEKFALSFAPKLAPAISELHAGICAGVGGASMKASANKAEKKSGGRP